jgi:Domain of unknown function (DUF4259)
MGNWGNKPFENDTALDLWQSLRRGADASLLSRAFGETLIRPDEYFDVPDAELAIAAGELVAAAFGQEGMDLPDGALAWAAARRNEVDVELLEQARLAVGRVLASAPLLMKSWFSHERAEEWLARVEDLRERLEQARPSPRIAED